jgi:hypothetical protein
MGGGSIESDVQQHVDRAYRSLAQFLGETHGHVSYTVQIGVDVCQMQCVSSRSDTNAATIADSLVPSCHTHSKDRAERGTLTAAASSGGEVAAAAAAAAAVLTPQGVFCRQWIQHCSNCT